MNGSIRTTSRLIPSYSLIHGENLRWKMVPDCVPPDALCHFCCRPGLRTIPSSERGRKEQEGHHVVPEVLERACVQQHPAQRDVVFRLKVECMLSVRLQDQQRWPFRRHVEVKPKFSHIHRYRQKEFASYPAADDGCCLGHAGVDCGFNIVCTQWSVCLHSTMERYSVMITVITASTSVGRTVRTATTVLSPSAEENLQIAKGVFTCSPPLSLVLPILII